jgi:hypothetical protein
VATDDRQILVTGQASAPASFLIPGNGQIRPKAVFATFDGTGASGSFFPLLQIVSDGGETICEAGADIPISAGGSGDVSWFRGLSPLPSSSAVLPGTGVDRHITSQVVANNSLAFVSFDTVLFDDLGWFDPLNPTKITTNIPGQFLLTYTNAWVYPGGSGFAIQTGIDNSPVTRVFVSEQVSASAGQPNATSGTAIVNADAGAVFTLFLYQVSGGNMSTWIAGSAGTDVQSFPTLSVVRIGDRV